MKIFDYDNQTYEYRLPDNPEWQIDDELRSMAYILLNTEFKKLPSLYDIRDTVGLDKIGFVTSHMPSRKYADCRKIDGQLKAYIPHDWLITFYRLRTIDLSETQQYLLMYHELRHIGLNEKIVDHDVKDFHDILSAYGVEWASKGEVIEDLW